MVAVGVALRMNFRQLTVANVGVDGGGVQTGVAEDPLDRPESGTAIHEVRRAGVVKQVACAGVRESGLIEVAADHVPEASGREGVAIPGDK